MYYIRCIDIGDSTQMAQHFLLSAKARTLSVVKVARMSEEKARAMFHAIRWADTDGDPVCPQCGCFAVYEYKSRPIFKCKGCGHQFSVTSGTIFASRKLPVRDYLLAIALFVNGAKGMSALQLGRNLDVQYKTAYVLAMKLREAMAAEHDEMTLSGDVEIDGAYFGGHMKPENRKEDRKDRRLKENQTGKRRVVVVMRERGGRTLPFVFRSEDASVPTIRARVETGSTVYAETKRQAGMTCTPVTTCTGSTIQSRSRTKTPAPTKPKASFPGCAARKSARITGSAAST